MDKIKQLQERRTALEQKGKTIRAGIRELVDEDSFVEFSAFSFSGKRHYGEEPEGEGVLTGFATIDGYPFYIVAQDFERDFGGLSKANCEKISRTLNAAEKNETPVIYLLHSQGAKLGEGVDVLEGIAELLLKATQLKGTVPQYAVVGGEVYGAAAALAAICDAVFFLKEGALAVTSPLVLSAKSGKNLKKEEVGGYRALKNAGLAALEIKDLQEASAMIKQMTELFTIPVTDAELNDPLPALNEKTDPETLMGIFGEALELGANSSPEVRTVLGRVGGIAVAAVIFREARLNANNLKKIRNFAELACCYGLPFVTFVDCLGVEESLAVNDSSVLKEISEYLNILDAIDTAKVAVVIGHAVGLGYSLFAAKSAGFDYTYALAGAQVALFENERGAEIVYANEKNKSKAELLALYSAEYSDPINAAKGGYLDNVIEPQFLKQYLVASLQMLVR